MQKEHLQNTLTLYAQPITNKRVIRTKRNVC